MIRQARRFFSSQPFSLTNVHHQGAQVSLLALGGNKVHSINPEFNAEFGKSLDAAKEANKPLVVIAEGSTFSAGLDLPYIFSEELDDAESERRCREVLTGLGDNIVKLMSFPSPTVAALNGHALAGGAIIACACDERVAVGGTDATFGAIEVKVGVPFPAWAFESMRKACNRAVQPDAILRGKVFKYEDAYDERIISDLTEDDEMSLLEAALDLATVIPAESMDAYAATKEQWIEQSLVYIRENTDKSMDRAMLSIYQRGGLKQIRKTIARFKKK